VAKRSPAWSREELILALALYFEAGGPLEDSDPRVVSLSQLLRRLTIHAAETRAPTFRNTNGVSMKLMNIERLDPARASKGLSAGGRLEADLWREFVSDRHRLRSLATLIRDSADAAPDSRVDESEAAEYAEGRYLYRIHRTRERSQPLVKRKRQQAWQSGCLHCEVCGLKPLELYAADGERALECHHVIPLYALKPGARTRLTDLALVCASCHRVIHASNPPLVPVQLANSLLTSLRLVDLGA
jgi:5-methylcytosine-specific restriction protein A